jgi:hypothetical protein
MVAALSHHFQLFQLEMYINMSRVMFSMTRVMTGQISTQAFCTQSLTPSPVKTPVKQRG